MFDQRAELLKFKIMLGALAAFMVSGYFTYKELQYALFARSATGRLIRSFETYDLSRHGRRVPKRGLKYGFTAGDGSYHERTNFVSMSFRVPEDGRLEVQYRPGLADSARIKGTHYTTSLVVFLGCVIWLGYSGFGLYKEARRVGPRAEKGHRKRRKKRALGTADDYWNHQSRRTREACRKRTD